MKRYVKHEMTVVLAVLALGLLVVSAFTLNFWHEPVASQSSRWGEFGDYVGGVLNPAVALAALALLARSIRLQRTELGDTRRVLNEQAKSAATTAKLAALSSLINSINAEISIHRDHLRFLVHQLEQQEATVGQDAASMDGPMADSIRPMHALDGTLISRPLLMKMLSDIAVHIQEKSMERNALAKQVNDVLRSNA